LINTKLNGVDDSDAIRLPVNCTQPCYDLEFTTSNPKNNITFNYELYVSNIAKYVSPDITIIIEECKPDDTTIQMPDIPSLLKYDQYEDENNYIEFELDKSKCSNQICCLDL